MFRWQEGRRQQGLTGPQAKLNLQPQGAELGFQKSFIVFLSTEGSSNWGAQLQKACADRCGSTWCQVSQVICSVT